jgi:hypothetical protein
MVRLRERGRERAEEGGVRADLRRERDGSVIDRTVEIE